MIKVGTLAKIRRLYFRDKQSIKEICRQTGLSRNTVRSWLRDPKMVEPEYPVRVVVSKLDAYTETLSLWLKADSGRGKRERRPKGKMWQVLCELGYLGSYGRVCAFARLWKIQEGLGAAKGAFIPLKFRQGEAFQFDWSTEYTFISGIRRRVELAHTKLCASGWEKGIVEKNVPFATGMTPCKRGQANRQHHPRCEKKPAAKKPAAPGRLHAGLACCAQCVHG